MHACPSLVVMPPSSLTRPPRDHPLRSRALPKIARHITGCNQAIPASPLPILMGRLPWTILRNGTLLWVRIADPCGLATMSALACLERRAPSLRDLYPCSLVSVKTATSITRQCPEMGARLWQVNMTLDLMTCKFQPRTLLLLLSQLTAIAAISGIPL